MKVLSLVCIGGAVVIIIFGVIAKYYTSVAYIRPGNFLLIAQILILLGINFAIMELLRRK